jgi:hypothetical protein
LQAVETFAVEAVHNYILQRENFLIMERLEHVCCSLGFAPQDELLRHLARGTARGIVIRQPDLQQE